MKPVTLSSTDTGRSAETTVFSMEILLGEKDIEAIAKKVNEYLRVLLCSNTNINDELITVGEAAILLKRSKGTIYQLANKAKHGLSKFPYLKQGRQLRFSKHALLRWSSEKNRVGLGEPNRKKAVRSVLYHFNMYNVFERCRGVIPEGRGSFTLIK